MTFGEQKQQYRRFKKRNIFVSHKPYYRHLPRMKKEINSTEDKGNNSAHMQTYFRFQDLFLRHSQVTSQVREYNPSSNYKLVLKNVVHTLNFEGI